MMPDRNEVIEGLKKVWDAFDNMEHELYADYVFDALALLKEQEPERVEIVDSDGGRTNWYVCGGCKTPINQGDRFCHECGRVVKWK